MSEFSLIRCASALFAGGARIVDVPRVTDEVMSAWAAGRVNLIGDHTDYTGGLAAPMTIQFGTTVTVRHGGTDVRLRSDRYAGECRVPIDVRNPAATEPAWARYVAGVVAELHPPTGATGHITSDLPIGAGLSSSASLEVAVALALGADDDPGELAQMCQRAEQRASGVPCGILDQLAITHGRAGHLLRLDCTTREAIPVPLPSGVEVFAVHSGEARALDSSQYALRRAQCAAAERLIGPLRTADVARVQAIDDPLIRSRARHVVTENLRVDAFVAALRGEDIDCAGRLMVDSHASLRDDFEVSTPVVDRLVEAMLTLPGVRGARMTGGGFGGVVVAICDPGTTVPVGKSWRLRAVNGTVAPRTGGTRRR